MDNGLTIGAYGYGGEEWPTQIGMQAPIVVRSLDVWSPGNGQIEYLSWSSLEPSQGVYNWAALDSWIAANQSNGAQMVYTFDLTGSVPSWAETNGQINWSAFQDFVTAIVEHANGAIKYWEGANEFNAPDGIGPQQAAQAQQINLQHRPPA
jgi:hypothetical protein